MLNVSKIEFIFSFTLMLSLILFLYLYLSLEINTSVILVITLYYMGPLVFFLKGRISLDKTLLSATVKSSIFIVLSFPFIFFFIKIFVGPGLASHVHFNAVEAFMFGHLSADEAFHASLINSIKTKWYQSAGLNDYVFVPYHALTHYFDALLLRAIEKHTLDLYGPITLPKAFLFVCVMMFFSVNVCRSNSLLVFFVHFCCCYSFLFYHGNVIGSYPLWMPSLLFLLFWKKIKKVLTSEISVNTALSFVVFTTVFTLGKFSLGTAFLGIAGLVIILRNYSSALTYISVLSAFALFCAYSLLITKGLTHNVDRENLSLLLYYSKPILEVLPFALGICLILPNGFCRKMIVPLLTYPIVMRLAALIIPIWHGDYTWFVDGYRYICSVFILSDLGCLLSKKPMNLLNGNSSMWKNLNFKQFNYRQTLRPFSQILLLTLFLYQAHDYFDKMNHKVIYTSLAKFPYLIFNKYKAPEELSKRISIHNRDKPKVHISSPSQQAIEELMSFRAQLHDFTKLNQLLNSPIFLDENAWKVLYDLRSKIGDQKGGIEDNWGQRLAFSAFIGLPLINGIPSGVNEFNWGLGFYNSSYFWSEKLSTPICGETKTYIDVKFQNGVILQKDVCKLYSKPK